MFELQATIQKREFSVTAEFKGRANRDPFEGRAAGTVVYLGFVGSKVEDGVWGGVHRFGSAKGDEQLSNFGEIPGFGNNEETDTDEVSDGIH